MSRTLCLLLCAAALPGFTQGFSDDFDGPALNPRWEWFVPKAGPTVSLTDSPRPNWMSLLDRYSDDPPSSRMPTSKETRVRVEDLENSMAQD